MSGPDATAPDVPDVPGMTEGERRHVDATAKALARALELLRSAPVPGAPSPSEGPER